MKQETAALPRKREKRARANETMFSSGDSNDIKHV